MTNRAKALEAFTPDQIKNLRACFEQIVEDLPSPTKHYAAIETIRAALQDAPRVEVIDGLEDAIKTQDAIIKGGIEQYEARDNFSRKYKYDWEEPLDKAARSYAKLQGKGE